MKASASLSPLKFQLFIEAICDSLCNLKLQHFFIPQPLTVNNTSQLRILQEIRLLIIIRGRSRISGGRGANTEGHGGLKNTI